MKLGINGFGRIGRNVFRIAFEDPDVEVVHVNDIGDTPTLAHLLAHDTVHGGWDHEVSGEGNLLMVDGQSIPMSAERDPADLPWKNAGAEVVLESTGRFRRRGEAEAHRLAGARKVLVSAPGKDELDGDYVLGVNGEQYNPEKEHVVSIGSCTTNCLAPLAHVIHQEFGLEHGLINTVHAMTATQNLLDGPHKDLRRARAAADNIIPTSTGAAKAIGKILPELQGRLNGLAVRVPVACGSLLDLTCRVEQEVNPDRVNGTLRRWADEKMPGILQVADTPLVSSDIVGNPHSAIVSPQDTMVTGGGRFLRVLAWYDNEWGFSSRCVDMLKRLI
jgi:glyceraldehyde 3-phosphate dehydrogenase